MSKTFTFAGTCVVDGATVYKFANDANRAAVLTKLGATDVNIIQLPFGMGKEEAVEWLNGQGIVADKVKIRTKPATVTVKIKAPAKFNDDSLREAYADAMFERKANGMPAISFAQYKRDADKAAKFFASCDVKLAAKREAGKFPA
jgi:hypothetical protein